MPRFRFENYTTANGLPANHVYAVLVDGARIWAGTDDGLVYTKTESGRPTRRRTAWRTEPCSRWLWTNARAMCGPARWAAEPDLRRAHRQLYAVELGLSNNVVYGVSVEGENVWVATASGACRLNLHTGEWSLYNERKHAHARDLGLRGFRYRDQGLLRSLG